MASSSIPTSYLILYDKRFDEIQSQYPLRRAYFHDVDKKKRSLSLMEQLFVFIAMSM